MQVNYNRYIQYLKYLSIGIGVRPVGSHALQLTGDYIFALFNKIGLSTYKMPFNYQYEENNVVLENIVGEIKARDEKKVLMFVAHYDTVPTSKGGIDNSSGVAVIMELANSIIEIINSNKDDSNTKALKDINKDTTFRFVALCGEEVGCVGSKNYLQEISKEEKDKIIACYNFDMFMSYKSDDATLVVNTMGGYKNGEYLLGEDSNPMENIISKSIQLSMKENCVNDFPQYNEIWCPRNYGHSDHQSFHEEKIESANVTIRGSKRINGKLPAGYHSEKDRYYPDQFDFEKCKFYLNVVLNSIKYIK